MARTLPMPNRDSVPGLAASLKAAREAAGLTQVEAGRRSGVHHVSIARFETDKATPTVRVLYKLAAAYGVAVCDLLPGGGRPPAKVERPAPAANKAKGKAGGRK